MTVEIRGKNTQSSRERMCVIGGCGGGLSPVMGGIAWGVLRIPLWHLILFFGLPASPTTSVVRQAHPWPRLILHSAFCICMYIHVYSNGVQHFTRVATKGMLVFDLHFQDRGRRFGKRDGKHRTISTTQSHVQCIYTD